MVVLTYVGLYVGLTIVSYYYLSKLTTFQKALMPTKKQQSKRSALYLKVLGSNLTVSPTHTVRAFSLYHSETSIKIGNLIYGQKEEQHI
jgi:hypothetical protein